MKCTTKKHYWLVLILFMGFWISGCATQETKPPDIELESSLPEVRKISFNGNEQFSAWALRGVMSTKPRPFLQPWAKGEPYNSTTLEEDLLRLRKFYFDRGFLNTTAKVANVDEDPEENAVVIEIDIEEGPQTKVKSVRIAGEPPSELPDKKVILSRLPLHAGGSLNKEDFEGSRDKLLELMQDKGYARAKVVAQTTVDEDRNEAIVTFNLQPGELTTIRQITVKGAERVPERIVRRQIDIHEGDTFSAEILEDNQEYVFDLGMFYSVTPRLLNIEDSNAPLDIEFEVNERKPRTGRLGIGASSVESMRYEVQWIHRNLFQDAKRLSLLASVSGIQQGIDVELHDPFFLNNRNSLTYRLFGLNNQRIDTDPFGILDSLFDIVDPQPAYDLLSFGGDARVIHDFTRKLTGVVGLELSRNDFYNVDPALVLESGLEAVEDNLLFVQFGVLEWNSRDDDLNPTMGTLLIGQVDHSNKGVISDVSYFKLTLDNRYYFNPFRDIVLATRFKLGGIEPYGESEDVPANVRYYAGGPGSVRGFELNRLGPLDLKGNPVGGKSLIEGSIEMRFPILGDIGGVIFVDTGNVFTPAFTYPLDELRYSVGLGIRYLTPVGPLRLDVGFVLNPRDNEPSYRPEFSIGQAF